MQTITDISTNRGISPTSARVAVRRAYEKLGEAMPKETTNETLLPENILALIQNKGAKIGKVNGSAVLEAEPEQDDLKPDVVPEVKTQPVRRKREPKPVALPETPQVEEIKPPVEKADLLETVLNKKITVLIALGVCIAVDGYCAGLVSEREINTPGAFWVFGVCLIDMIF